MRLKIVHEKSEQFLLHSGMVIAGNNINGECTVRTERTEVKTTHEAVQTAINCISGDAKQKRQYC